MVNMCLKQVYSHIDVVDMIYHSENRPNDEIIEFRCDIGRVRRQEYSTHESGNVGCRLCTGRFCLFLSTSKSHMGTVLNSY